MDITAEDIGANLIGAAVFSGFMYLAMPHIGDPISIPMAGGLGILYGVASILVDKVW